MKRFVILFVVAILVISVLSPFAAFAAKKCRWGYQGDRCLSYQEAQRIKNEVKAKGSQTVKSRQPELRIYTCKKSDGSTTKVTKRNLIAFKKAGVCL